MLLSVPSKSIQLQARRDKKFGAYISEKKILEELGERLGLPIAPNGFARHPLAFLVEAADDICYAVLDLEDAVEMRIIRFSEAADVLLGPFDRTEKQSIRQTFPDPNMHRVNFSRIRGPLFDKLIGATVDAFNKNYDHIMNGTLQEGLLEGSDSCSAVVAEAKKLSRTSIFTDSKKVEIEIGCYAVFDTLLSSFISAAMDKARVIADPNGSTLSWKASSVLRLLGDHAPGAAKAPEGGWTEYECIRRVIDFVDGMTDNYAIYLSKQLQGNGFSGGQRA